METVTADDDVFQHLFPEAVFELESKLPGRQYVAFLEELYETRREVFSLSADWTVRSMVFEYLAQERLDDVDRVALALATNLQEIGEPFFSLLSTIRLAGRADAAQALINAAIGKMDDSSLMYWAVDEHP